MSAVPNGYMDRNKRDSTSTAFSILSDLTPLLSHTLALEYQEDKEESPYWGSPILNPVGDTMKIDKRRRFENYNVGDGRYEQRVRWVRSIIDYQVNDSTSRHLWRQQRLTKSAQAPGHYLGWLSGKPPWTDG